MSDQKRTITQVRTEITTERRLLGEDIRAIREEIRPLLPYAAGGIAALGVLTRGRGFVGAYRLLRLLR